MKLGQAVKELTFRYKLRCQKCRYVSNVKEKTYRTPTEEEKQKGLDIPNNDPKICGKCGSYLYEC